MLEKEIKESIQEILGLCLDAKMQGHDVFFDYNAHVDWCDVRVCVDGFGKKKCYDKIFGFVHTNITNDSDRETIEKVFAKHKEVKDYLKQLVGEET